MYFVRRKARFRVLINPQHRQHQPATKWSGNKGISVPMKMPDHFSSPSVTHRHAEVFVARRPQRYKQKFRSIFHIKGNGSEPFWRWKGVSG